MEGGAEAVTGPRVFVSYAHESPEHIAQVVALCKVLVAHGVRVVLDQWAGAERRDWSRWALAELPAADFVLAVASPSYKRRAEGAAIDGDGWGSQVEGALLRELLTAQPSVWTRRVLPVVLPGRRVSEIPLFLLPHIASHYEVVQVTADGARELLAALLPAVPAGDAAAGPAVVDRVVAPSRPALTDPARLVIPIQERANLRQVFVPAVRQALATPAVVAVHADAGLGKSVLLGQLHDVFAAEPDIGVVLVSLGAAARTRAADAVELDHQLGAAIRRPGPLTGLVELQRAQGLRPLVLVDTLDLILDEDSRPVITEWLLGMVDLGVPVVFTCRSFDFRAQFEPLSERAPLLATLIDRREVYPLREDEAVAFARAYLTTVTSPEAGRDPDRNERFLARLLHLRGQRRAVVEVCGSPLLLALTCQVYGPTGDVPEDLTVSRLFTSYWGRHVLRSTRRSLAIRESGERSRLCLAGARQLLVRSTSSFVEEFDAAGIEPPVADAVYDELSSGGVLVPGSEPARFRFFHQTFAEWLIARHLVTDAADRDAFLSGLDDTAAAAHRAPVLVQLLYQVADEATYRRIVDALDPTSQLIFRALVLAAAVRGEVDRIRRWAEYARSAPAEHQGHLVDALRGVGDEVVPVVVPVAVDVVRWAGDSAVFAAARMSAGLVARLQDGRATALDVAFGAVLARSGGSADGRDGGDKVGDDLARVFLVEFASAAAVTGTELAVLAAHYPVAGARGRAQILLLHEHGDADAARNLLAVATSFVLMPEAAAAAATAVARVFAEPAAATALGWTDWVTTLGRQYAQGWDDAQCELVVRLVLTTAADAAGPAVTLTELMDLALAGDATLAQRALFVAEKVALRSPAVAVDLLMTSRPSTNRRALALVRAMLQKMPALDHDTAARLVAWLTAGLEHQRALATQSMAYAATGHADLLAVALQHAQGLRGTDHDRVVTAVLDACPPEDLLGLLPALRPVAARGNELAARVAGTFAPWDDALRRRCAEFVLGPASRPARSAAHRLTLTATELGWFDADYAATLLATTVPGAAQSVAAWTAAHTHGPLPPALARAVILTLARTDVPAVAEVIAGIALADVARGGPLLDQADDLAATVLDRAGTADADAMRAARGGDPAVDVLRVWMRTALKLLRAVLERRPTPAARPLVRQALDRLPLDLLDHAEDDIERVITRAGPAFRDDTTTLLDELLRELPDLNPAVQRAVARATRLDRGEHSGDFRTIAARATDPATISYVVRHLT